MFIHRPETIVRCSVCGHRLQLGWARFPANEQFASDAVAKARCLPHGKGLTFAELERKATIRPVDLRVTMHLHEVRGIRQALGA